MAGKQPVNDGAFHADPALKGEMLARINAHAANGTLHFGATAWDGEGGSPMGVAIQSTDIATYSDVYGYPLALAGLLDPLCALLRDTAASLNFAKGWAEKVVPGADLSNIPTRLALYMLDMPEAARLTPDIHAELISLHRRELAGEVVPRKQWSALRATVLNRAEKASRRQVNAVLKLFEAAAWPARTSRSLLTSMLGFWNNFAEYADDPDWSEEDRQRAASILDTLWVQQQGRADTKNTPSYPELFAAVDADLARRFEANLVRTNQLFADRINSMAKMVLDSFANAPMVARTSMVSE